MMTVAGIAGELTLLTDRSIGALLLFSDYAPVLTHSCYCRKSQLPNITANYKSFVSTKAADLMTADREDFVMAKGR